MAIIEIAKIQIRRGQETVTGMPKLDPGEFGWAEDTENLYLGKRISEGATTDDNTRILTEKDLTNLFNLVKNPFATLGGNLASTSTYRYRDSISTTVMHSQVISIGSKLDTTVNLIDFGVTPSFTATDITTKLTQAIQDIFNNSTLKDDAKRAIRIPAGNYNVANVIDLPPGTRLIGEGPGLTSLIMTGNSSDMFRTVDSFGVNFSSGTMSAVRSLQAREISIENMTLGFSTTSSYALLSLDNVYSAKIKSVNFKSFTSSTVFDTLVTGFITTSGSLATTCVVNISTYPQFSSITNPVNPEIWYLYEPSGSSGSLVGGTAPLTLSSRFAKILGPVSIVGSLMTFETTSTNISNPIFLNPNQVLSLIKYNSYGIGIRIRGTGGAFATDQSKLSVNTVVSDCQFDHLDTGIIATGTVTRIVAQNNVFNDLRKGVHFLHASGADPIGPTNAHITENRFQSIAQEAIHIGSNPSFYPTNHVTSYNSFIQVGNDLNIIDVVTTSTFPVIRFQSPGNKTEFDYFNRKTIANIIESYNEPYFYYNPLVVGNTNINDGSAFTATVSVNSQTVVNKIPLLTDQPQLVKMKYHLRNVNTFSNLSRMGTVQLGITPTGEGMLDDNYNYAENAYSLSTVTDNMVPQQGSGIDTLVVSANLSALTNITAQTSNLYIGTTSTNDTAFVESIEPFGGNYLVRTQSVPQFVYTSTITVSLLQIDSPLITFNTKFYTTGNYVNIIINNSSTSTVLFEYNTDVMI